MLIHTFPPSIHFVNITIVSRLCSQTIRQKSCTVLVMGPIREREIEKETETKTERDRERETERETERDRDRGRDRDRERQRER